MDDLDTEVLKAEAELKFLQGEIKHHIAEADRLMDKYSKLLNINK